jgi:FlaA1/EpsC-like NDP-sugar epimerase
MINLYMEKLVKLPRAIKFFILMGLDVLLVMLALWASFSLRLGEFYFPAGSVFGGSGEWSFGVLALFIAAPIIAIPVFVRFGLYRAILRFLGYRAAWSVARAIFVYALIWAVFALLSGVQGLPRSVVLINFLVTFLTIGGARALMRFSLAFAVKKKPARHHRKYRVVIYGAGSAGRQLAQSMVASDEFGICGFVDDAKDLWGRELFGVPVVAPSSLAEFARGCGATDLLIAIPSATHEERKQILEFSRRLPLRVRTLPAISELLGAQVGYALLQELDIDDLLGRVPAELDSQMLKETIRGKVVLVTGAGGSIGGELARQIIRFRPKILLLLEQNEFALYSIHYELITFLRNLEEDAGREDFTRESPVRLVPRVLPVLGSVQSYPRMRELLDTWSPNVIYHAAAYKHVPIVEHNPAEGIKNNVFGTLSLARAAMESGVSNFVLISTDKAVRPTNVMGATKRLAEMTLQALASESDVEWECLNEPKIKIKNETHFSMVRFGNVLGSSGSVVPLFRKQILSGGPVTLTDPEVTRFFMSISEAAQLVMQAAALVDRTLRLAEVFLLDMGEPVKIVDLAKRMIELSGLRVKDKDSPGGDIEIEVIGLRPGEKRYEELLIDHDPLATAHPRIFKAREKYMSWDSLQVELRSLRIATDNNDAELIRKLLKKLVVGYQPGEDLVDWVYLEQVSKR